LHRVCHIADLLLSLQHVGNVKYIGWSLQVMCCASADFIVNTLQDQIDHMNAELNMWNHNVKCMRNDFYELNYYTTSQLLVLRQALIKLKHNETCALETEVLFLLQSISAETELELVVSAVKLAMKETIKLKDELHSWDEKCQRPDTQMPESIKSPHKETTKYWWPNLEENDLSDNQKMIMAFVIGYSQCNKKIILKAFEDHKDEKLDKYDYDKLCTKLQIEYEVSDDESEESSDESESFQSDNDSDDEDVRNTSKT